jgi:hypothetical protein
MDFRQILRTHNMIRLLYEKIHLDFYEFVYANPGIHFRSYFLIVWTVSSTKLYRINAWTVGGAFLVSAPRFGLALEILRRIAKHYQQNKTTRLFI